MKKDNGAIALFVVIVMIIIIGAIIVMSMKAAQKNDSQSQQIEKIRQEYESDDLEEEYMKTLENNQINNNSVTN